MATTTRLTRSRAAAAAAQGSTTPTPTTNNNTNNVTDSSPTPNSNSTTEVTNSITAETSSPSSTSSHQSPSASTSSSPAVASTSASSKAAKPSSSTAAAAAHIPGTNVYPPGCKEVHEEMHVDELIRRLKVLASTFQSMGQEENAYDEYVPLCLHLADEGFLNHSSRDVRLLIACCIADILRIYAPEAPYKDQEQVKTIFKFLISQLEGLKDPKDAAFKRYFYLLENLAYVKSFNMCFELEDAQDIFCSLFELIFSIVNDEHSGKVKAFMLDILCPLVSECDTVSNELLNIILVNIVEPVKSSKKNAYNLAKELIIKCSETLESYIQNFFNQVLICGKEDQNLLISHKVYDLIYELNHICPSVLLSVIPQLEYKLKSPDEAERLGSVSLLARMFSEKESKLALHHTPLWQAFLGRFNDISVSIRTKCVQYSMHFLINHPELRNDIVETLRLRQHDGEENVRFEVVKAIVATAKLDFNIVSESEDLLNYVKERTLDKKFKIRREALQGLALIYKKHLGMENVPEPTERAAAWIKDKILHGYYMTGLDDRILVERLLNTCLVPYQLDPRDRMMKLLYLYSTIDTNASKAFIEIQKNLLLVRRHVSELLNVIRNHENVTDYSKQLNYRISSLTKFLPDPVKASEFICKFSNDLKDDKALMRTMEIIVSPTTDCKACADSVNLVLKKLGAPVMTNLYYNTIKILLERTSSVLIDKEAVTKLVAIIQEIVKGDSEFSKSFNVADYVAMEKGFNLVSVLAFVFSNHFDDEKVLEMLIELLGNDHLSSEHMSRILAALMYIGKTRPIGQHHPNLMGILVPQCQNMLLSGTPRQGKMAVRCLFVNMKESARNHTFAQVVENLRGNLDPANSSYRTAIVALGHIAFLMPEEFKYDMKAIVSQKIVKELLVNPQRTYEDHLKNTDSWCDEDDLPEITRCMMAGMKSTVRWLMGLKTDFKSAAKTFKMLTAFVETGGTFINAEVPFSNAEKAWLRLSAGSCMLKICEQKGVGDQFTAVQFCSLAKLMNDEVIEVRTRFANKLHKGLARGIPHKCLPLDFMGFYALAGYETDKKLKNMVKAHMTADVNHRREYIKQLLLNAAEKAADQLPHIMPDYMLVFAVPVLTHNPRFTSHLDADQLTAMKECLWFIMEPLIVKNDSYSFGFYKTLVERMKNHKNALEPENDQANCRMYAICDIALGLILQRSSSFEMKDYPSEPRIPPMYFKRHEDPYFLNQRAYLPAEMQYAAPKKAGVTVNVESTSGPGTATNSASSTSNSKAKKRKGKRENLQVVDEHGNVSIDAQPTDAKLTRLEIPGN
ncbi:unnamed protein product [Orchesella dallaii]|uniref:Sister chromatid cohesion protein PDS5 B n=1 Tax=Orchesella dallaii TaxID=48710 RepID=A0ABP1QPB7_9HEXA